MIGQGTVSRFKTCVMFVKQHVDSRFSCQHWIHPCTGTVRGGFTSVFHDTAVRVFAC